MNKAGNYLTVAISEQTIADTYVIDRAALTIAPVEGTEFFSMKVISDKFIGNTGSSYGINMNAATVYENAISIDADGYALITNAGSTTTGEYTNLFCYNSLSTSNRFGFYNPEGANSNKLSLYKKDGTGPDKVYYYTTNPIVTEACTHENTQLSGNVAATCTEPGYTGDMVCIDCGIVITEGEVLPATGHTEVTDNAVAATCTTTGLTEGSHCSVCGVVIVAQNVVPATGHTEVTDAAVAPTCTETGLTEGSHCSVCGVTIVAQEVVAATGHSYTYTDNEDGTHTATCSVCNGTVTEDHTFTNGTCVCDAAENHTIAVTINNTLSLEGATTLNYFVAVTAMEGYDSFYLTVDRTIYNTTTKTYENETRTLYARDDLYRGTYYWFEYDNIAAMQLNDPMYATLHAVKDGVEYTTEPFEYRPMTYCYSIANRTTVDMKLRTTMANMILYCAAAQTYFNYNTENMATANWTSALDAIATIGDPEVSATKSSIVLEGQTAEIKTYTLDVSGRVGINFYTLPSSGVDYKECELVCTYTDMNGAEKTVTIPGSEWKYYNSTYGYIATVNTMNAAEMRQMVSAVVYKDGVAISNTYSVSVEAYAVTIATNAANNPSNTTYANLNALMKAMINYGDAAKAYLVG